MTDNTEYKFDFEKLDVYKKSLEFVKTLYNTARDSPREYQFSLADQLRRAGLSVVNNIAEGSGYRYKKEKARFYKIALMSARECIPMLTILSDNNIINYEKQRSFREDCVSICKMLTKLIKSVEK